MKIAQVTAALLASVLAAANINAAQAACSTPEWGQCGKSDGTVGCCPGTQYCQPWDSGNVQCRPTPPMCEGIETNIDYQGNDITTVYGVQPDVCCQKCNENKDCAAFTFINHRAGPPACYLKRAGKNKVKLVGAISGYKKGSKPSKHSRFHKQGNGCKTNAWGKCGDSNGSFCCPSGQYCQPWNPGYYQCIQIPDRCPTQITDVDFPGNDIAKAQAGTGDECCKACQKNPKCKAYTFVNFNNNGPQCYLKSSAGDGKGKRLVGAVSAKL